MHFVLEVLVEADSKEKAIGEVEKFMETEVGHLCDWYEVGGRWKGLHDTIINYKKDRKKFNKTIKWALDETIIGLKNNVDVVKEQFKKLDIHRIKNLDKLKMPNPTKFEWSLVGFNLENIGKIIHGSLCSNTHFYDLREGVTYLCPTTKEDMDEEPEKWYLVTVDYHT